MDGTGEKQVACRYRTRSWCVCFFLIITLIWLCFGVTVVRSKVSLRLSSRSCCVTKFLHCCIDIILMLYRRSFDCGRGFGGLVTARVGSCFFSSLLCAKYKPECALGIAKLESEIFLLYIGISHRSSFLFLVPSSTILLSFTTANFFFERTTRQSSSHSCPMEISEALFNFGSTIAF